MPFPRSGTFPASAFCSAAALLFCVFAAPRGRGMLVREGKTHVWEGKVPRLSEKEGDGARWGRQGARQGGRSLGRYGKGGRSVGRREGPVGRGEARSSEKGRPFGRKEPRQVRGGSVGGADTRLPEVPCGVHFRRKGCLRSRIGGPNDTNRIKNTRFGLPFNEKFGMFVHMNRIRLAEVTLIGHATGSLSGTCAGRGTGGENIWCFMSPAR